MFINKVLSIAIVCLLAANIKSSAQIQVGSGESLGGSYGTAKKIKKEQMELFRASTLVVTIPNKDSSQIDYYKQELSKVWKLTPFEVITISRIKEYSNKQNYSFATFGGIEFTMGAGNKHDPSFDKSPSFGDRNNQLGPSREVPSFIYDYEVWMPDPKKMMNVKERYVFARILLQPDIETNILATKNTYDETTWGRVRFGQGPAARLYETATFYNFGYGFLKGYFKAINDILTNEEAISLQYNLITKEDKAILNQVKSDTLFALDIAQKSTYVSEKAKKDITKEMIEEGEKGNNEDLKDVDQKSVFIVKYLTMEEMNERIRTTKSPFFYFNYVETSNGKYVNVFEAQSGKLVFQRHDLFMSAMRKADFYFKKISKEIN